MKNKIRYFTFKIRHFALMAFLLFSLNTLAQLDPGDEDPDAEDIPIDGGVLVTLTIGSLYFTVKKFRK
jgi:hypothetical protein